MSQSVRVKIRPENSLKFPAICVHCGQPAGERMRISKRKRSITRLIEVPVCTNCYQEINRRSWAEERWQRIGLLVTGATGTAVLALSFFLLPSELPVWLRLLASIILAGLVALGLRGIIKQRSAEMARPEKKAILTYGVAQVILDRGLGKRVVRILIADENWSSPHLSNMEEALEALGGLLLLLTCGLVRDRAVADSRLKP